MEKNCIYPNSGESFIWNFNEYVETSFCLGLGGRMQNDPKDKFANNRWALNCLPRRADPGKCRTQPVLSRVCEVLRHR